MADEWDEVGKLQEEASMGVNAEAPPESEPPVADKPEFIENKEQDLSPEDMLKIMANDLGIAIQRLMTLESHHSTTINLMKALAEYQGLELVQEEMPDNKVLIGWKQKKVIMAPNMVNFPNPRNRN